MIEGLNEPLRIRSPCMRVYGGGKVTWHSKKGGVRRVREWKRPVDARRGRWVGKWGERTLTGSFSLFESVGGWKGDVAFKKW